MNAKAESMLLFHFRRGCCNIGVCAAAFLIVFAIFIASVVWAITFVSGYITVNFAISNIKNLVRRSAIFELEDSLKKPAEMLRGLVPAADAFNVTFTMDDESRVNLHKMMMRTVNEYKEELGVSIYYGTWEDGYGATSARSSGEFRDTFALYGISKRSTYDDEFRLVATPTFSNFSYKPTPRPWYRESLQKGAPGISNVYVFVGADAAPGITYTHPWYNNSAQIGAIFAVDYVLNDMNTLLRGIEVGKTGSSFLVERNGLLLASSKNITFVDAEGTRLSALQSPDGSQKEAAEVIEGNGGFRSVPNGFSNEYSGKIVEVFEVNPVLNTSGEKLLAEPWLVVLVYNIFTDYTQIILWSTLGNVFVAMVAVIVSCVIAIGFVLCAFVIPINMLVRDMAVVQTMELHCIKKRRIIPIFEISQMQKSFYRTVEFLQLYRSFLPSYLVQDQGDEEAQSAYGGSVNDGIAGDENGSETGSKRSSRSAGSVRSQTTGILSNHTGIQSRAMQKLRKFEIGLEHGEGVALVLNIMFWKEVVDMNQKEFVEQHTRIISVAQGIFRLHGGMLDRFSESKIVGSFFEMRRGVLAAVDLRKKLNSLTTQFKMQYTHHVDFSLGLAHGEVAIGVLGDSTLRSKRVFGLCVKNAKKLSLLGAEWPCKLFVDRDTLKRIDKKKWICRPVATQPSLFTGGPIHEIVSSTSIKSNEWIYEKHDMTKNESISLYRKAFELLEKENYSKAKELFQAYLEVNPEDALAQKHLNSVDALSEE